MLPMSNAPQQVQEQWNYGQRNYSLRKNRTNAFAENIQRFSCPRCHKTYLRAEHMLRHYRFECGIPPRFQCPYCDMKSKQSNNVYKHIRLKHSGFRLTFVRLH